MKSPILRLFLWPFIMGVFIAHLTGCASIKPNTPYSGPYPSGFSELSADNPLLALELGKIPEIQDGISHEDAKALERICVFYQKNQMAFDSAFEQMYEVGKPEVRKFCTPLQAMYWLALDNRLEEIDISKYTLFGLLNQSWYKPGFDYDGKGRWADFHDVTERLNSPELVDYYTGRNFTYKKVPGVGDNPRYIFKYKRGACDLYTSFSVYCLRKGGYRANAIIVFHGNSPVSNHVTCEFVDKDGKEYVLDNSINAYVHKTGIYEKEGYLKIYPYVRRGYISY